MTEAFDNKWRDDPLGSTPSGKKRESTEALLLDEWSVILDDDAAYRACVPIFREMNFLITDRLNLRSQVKDLDRRIEGLRAGVSTLIGKTVMIPDERR